MTSIFDIINRRPLIQKQAEVFLAWGKKRHTVSSSYDHWIDVFIRHTTKLDVLDITTEDVSRFMEYISHTSSSEFNRLQAEKCIRGFLKFYRTRGKNAKSVFTSGRPKTTIRLA